MNNEEMTEKRAIWKWDDKNNEPKCSVCGGRALYAPEINGYGAKVCFITLSPYCPHCGAKMDLTSKDDDD